MIKYSKKNILKWILFIFCILVIIFLIIFLINYLNKNKYSITEFFTNENSTTSHRVDLPLNNPNSCKNFCGPNSKCAITNEQCSSDVDCKGCSNISIKKKPSTQFPIPRGENDAGKLTFGAPDYSSLTAGYGTQTKIISKNIKPLTANYGVNVWNQGHKVTTSLFDKKYKPPNTLLYMPNYKKRYTLTGSFTDDGPLAANDILSN
jgi:hypothetical protein